MSIPESFNGSQAFQFITSKGWTWRNASEPNVELEKCPYCGKDNYHFRMEIRGSDDEQKNRDGLHICMRCGKSGSLKSLKEHLGVSIPGVESSKRESGKIEPLPDIEACHQALLEDEAAMDYLTNGRGFSREIIEKMKIGLVPKRYFRESGEVRALVYPYLVDGNCVFVHYRTLPTMPLSEWKGVKAFSSPRGWDVPLYNGEILRDGLKEVIMVEGEPDCISALDKGIDNICGVPGANFKKAEWIETLDKIGIEKVYICYDKDKVGQKAAKALAARIGIEKCWKIEVPEFDVTTEDGQVRKGKDLNEWFTQGGGTKEAFDKLLEDAGLFDVDGVACATDAVQEFYDEITSKGSVEPKYKTFSSSLNKVVGFDDGDVIDILAPEKVGKTTFGLNMVEHMVSTYGEDGVIVCLEMMRARMARKWICHLTGIADNIPKTPEEAQMLLGKFMVAVPEVQKLAAERPGQLYFCYPKYETVADILDLMRQIIRRYGVKWIMFDNLQLLADTTKYDSRTGRTEHLSKISKSFAQLAKEYGVQIIRILQPHRIGAGKLVSTDNVDGSSQIAKDCDVMITLHRNRIGEMNADQFQSAGFVEQEVAFSDDMLVTVGLSRYSSGGMTTLKYDGASSTVRDMDESQITKIKLDLESKIVNHETSIAALKMAVQAQLSEPKQDKPADDEEIVV